MPISGHIALVFQWSFEAQKHQALAILDWWMDDSCCIPSIRGPHPDVHVHVNNNIMVSDIHSISLP